HSGALLHRFAPGLLACAHRRAGTGAGGAMLRGPGADRGHGALVASGGRELWRRRSLWAAGWRCAGRWRAGAGRTWQRSVALRLGRSRPRAALADGRGGPAARPLGRADARRGAARPRMRADRPALALEQLAETDADRAAGPIQERGLIGIRR